MTDAQALLADVHLHSPDYQNVAGEEFEAVLKIDPNNAVALRGLGYLYLLKQDYGKAGDYFHKSAKINSNDPRALYYSALLSQRGASGTPGGDAARLESMQGELERSIRLDPGFADAYSILAFTYMSQGKRDEAIAVLRKAIELNPRNEQYRFNLAHLYLERGRLDEAASIFRVLQTSGDPQVAARAGEELAQVQMYRQQTRSAPPPLAPDRTGEPLMARAASPEPEAQSPKVVAAKFLHGTLLSSRLLEPSGGDTDDSRGSHEVEDADYKQQSRGDRGGSNLLRLEEPEGCSELPPNRRGSRRYHFSRSAVTYVRW